MTMKRISGLLLLSIFLAGCANVTPTPAPTETITDTPTLAPTDIPQPTLTATPDPLANAPEGTTGFDENGDPIMDAEDGYRYSYFDATAEQEAYWARPFIENYYAYDDWDFDAIPVDAWVKYGTPGADIIIQMTHENVRSFKNKNSVVDSLNKPLREFLGFSSLDELKQNLNTSAGVSYDFEFNGKTLTSNFGLKGGYVVTFVSEEELKPLYEQGKAMRSQRDNGFGYLIIDSVKDGRVLVRVASSQPLSKLLGKSPAGDPEYGFRFLFYWPLANLLVRDSDLLHVNNLTKASDLASVSALPHPTSGEQELQIILAP